MQVKGMRKRALCIALAGMLCAVSAGAQQYTFEVIAGGGIGDGGQAVNAHVQGAADVVRDAAGNLYVSQIGANRIRRIATDGSITTIAGGPLGFSGDGGHASAAKINRPHGLALDTAGNLFFVDSGNGRIRKIAVDGTISTVAGNGFGAPNGDGGPASHATLGWTVDALSIDVAGNLYFTVPGANSLVRKIAKNGTLSTIAGWGGSTDEDVPASSAWLQNVTGVDVDAAGNVYIADLERLRKVDTAGKITTVANVVTLSIDVQANGTVYAYDFAGCRIIKISGGVVTAVVGGSVNGGCDYKGDGGPLLDAGLDYAEGLDVDSAGNIYFGNSWAGHVRKANIAANRVDLVAGAGDKFTDGRPAIGAYLGTLRGVAVDSLGNIAVTQAPYNPRVLRIATNGGLFTHAKSELLPYPYDVAFDATDGLYVSERNYRKVYSIGGGGTLTEFGDFFTAPNAHGLAFDATGNLLVADRARQTVHKVDPLGVATPFAGTGRFDPPGDGGPATSAGLTYPMAVTVDGAGNTYIGEAGAIRKVAPDGTISTIAGNPAYDPTFAPDGVMALGAEIGSPTDIGHHATGLYFSYGGELRRITPGGRLDTIHGLPNSANGFAIRGDDLFVASGDGTLYRTTLAASAEPDEPQLYVKPDHDYNGDDKSDLMWRNLTTGANETWLSGDSAMQTVQVGVNPSWKIVAQGDFDGDGESDLFWRNSSDGRNVIWKSANNATQQAVVGVSTLAWAVVGAGDFDGDGKDDVLWRHMTTGQNAIWCSANNATQIATTTVSSMAWKVVGTGDFNADGKSDIVWRNTATGENRIWWSGSAATTQTITGVTNAAWKIVGVGDFNKDGISDLFWRNVSTGANTIWRSANNATQSPVVAVTSMQWRVVDVADYNGDGMSDVVWRNTGNGANTIWLAASNGNQQRIATMSHLPWSVVPYDNQP